MIEEFKPDFVHINYGDWNLYNPYIKYPCAVTTHFAYLERPEMMGPQAKGFDILVKSIVFDCLTVSIGE